MLARYAETAIIYQRRNVIAVTEIIEDDDGEIWGEGIELITPKTRQKIHKLTAKLTTYEQSCIIGEIVAGLKYG